MPELIPFRGLLYNQEKVKLEQVLAPPYDVISSDYQARLYERSPYNVVRLILGREADRYVSAASHLNDWQARSILVRDDFPALYVLWQTFSDDTGEQLTRKGFIALCRLEEFGKGVVLPHEKTLAKPREDRFKLLQAARSNFSQVFALYADAEQQVDRILNGHTKSAPDIDVTFEGVENRLWRVQDRATIERIQGAMREKQVLIADGHHRYETALAYRDLMKSQNPGHTGNELYNFVMMFFTNIDAEGLVIYPTHRIVHSLTPFEPISFVKSLEQYFILRDFKDRDSLMKGLRSSPSRSFGLVMPSEFPLALLSLKPTLSPRELVRGDLPDEVKQLDVTLLHSLVFREMLGISPEAQEQKLNIDYISGDEEVFTAVASGRAQLGFLMNPTKIAEVRAVAKAGHTMPQKSTYFYPKLPSGLVINLLVEGTPEGA